MQAYIDRLPCTVNNQSDKHTLKWTLPIKQNAAQSNAVVNILRFNCRFCRCDFVIFLFLQPLLFVRVQHNRFSYRHPNCNRQLQRNFFNSSRKCYIFDFLLLLQNGQHHLTVIMYILFVCSAFNIVLFMPMIGLPVGFIRFALCTSNLEAMKCSFNFQ